LDETEVVGALMAKDRNAERGLKKGGKRRRGKVIGKTRKRKSFNIKVKKLEEIEGEPIVKGKDSSMILLWLNTVVRRSGKLIHKKKGEEEDKGGSK